MEDGHGSNEEVQVSDLLTNPVLAGFSAGEFLADILSCFENAKAMFEEGPVFFPILITLLQPKAKYDRMPPRA